MITLLPEDNFLLLQKYSLFFKLNNLKGENNLQLPKPREIRLH
jgi:hypothetical protein